MNTTKELLERSLQSCDLGNYDEAIELAEKLLTLYQVPTGYFALGLVYAVQEKWELAATNCLEAYKSFPEVTDNLNRLGVAYCQLGDINEGLKYLKKGKLLGDENCSNNYNYWLK